MDSCLCSLIVHLELTRCPGGISPPAWMSLELYLDLPQAVSPMMMSFKSGRPSSSWLYSFFCMGNYLKWFQITTCSVVNKIPFTNSRYEASRTIAFTERILQQATDHPQKPGLCHRARTRVDSEQGTPLLTRRWSCHPTSANTGRSSRLSSTGTSLSILEGK